MARLLALTLLLAEGRKYTARVASGNPEAGLALAGLRFLGSKHLAGRYVLLLVPLWIPEFGRPLSVANVSGSRLTVRPRSRLTAPRVARTPPCRRAWRRR